MLSLGVGLVALVYGTVLWWQGQSVETLLGALAWPVLLGLLVEAAGLFMHARDLERDGGEGAASQYEQTTTFGKTYLARNAGLAFGVVMVLLLATAAPASGTGLAVWWLTAAVIAATAVVGRALFYALVIPTTMPGAFFWRNRGFAEHARESGLAEMPQVGVVPDTH